MLAKDSDKKAYCRLLYGLRENQLPSDRDSIEIKSYDDSSVKK